MNINNMVPVANELMAQVMGEQYNNSVSQGEIITTDLASICSWAKKATSGMYQNFPTEAWFEGLIDRVYRIEHDTRKLPLTVPSIFKTGHDWGAFLERVKYSVFDIIADPITSLATLGGDDIAKIEYETYKNEISASLFGNKNAFVIPYTRPREIIYSAATNENEFMKIVGGIIEAVNKTLTAIINTSTKALFACAIAKCEQHNNVRNLITEAVSLGLIASGATAFDFLHNDACVRYMLSEIETVRDNFENLDKNYTDGAGVAVFAPRSEQHVVMINQVKRTIEYNTAATTYHNTVLSTDTYDGINNWQGINDDGIGVSFDLQSVTTIDVKANAQAGLAQDVKGDYYVALLFDDKAIGITNNYSETDTTKRASVGDINAFMHCRLETIIDSEYKMCAFRLA